VSVAQPVHVERKVISTTLWMLLVTAGISVETGLDNANVLSNLGLPTWSQPVLLTVLPTVGTALIGWKTKHTARADLGHAAPVAAPVAQAPAVDTP